MSKRKQTHRLDGTPLEKKNKSACLSTDPTPSTSSEIHDTSVEEQTGKTGRSANWDESPFSWCTADLDKAISDHTAQFAGSAGVSGPVQESEIGSNEQQLAEANLQPLSEEQRQDLSEFVNGQCQHPSSTNCLTVIGKFEGPMEMSKLKGYCSRRDTVKPDEKIKLTERREYDKGYEYDELETVGSSRESNKVIGVFDRNTGKDHVKKVIKIQKFNDYEAISQHQLSDTGVCPELYMVKITKCKVELHMELIEGRLLSSIFEQSFPVFTEKIADLLMPFAFFLLAGGLQAVLEMAKKGFVHRDISANNVIIKKPSTDPISVILLDFGSADTFSVEDVKFDVQCLVGLFNDLRKMMKEEVTQFPEIDLSCQIKNLEELEQFYIRVKMTKDKVCRQELMARLNKQLFPVDYPRVPHAQRQISEGSCSEPSDDELCRQLRGIKDIEGALVCMDMRYSSENQPVFTESTFSLENCNVKLAELRYQILKPDERSVTDDRVDGNSSGEVTATVALSKSVVEVASFSDDVLPATSLSQSVDEVACFSDSVLPAIGLSQINGSAVEAKDTDLVKSQHVEK